MSKKTRAQNRRATPPKSITIDESTTLKPLPPHLAGFGPEIDRLVDNFTRTGSCIDPKTVVHIQGQQTGKTSVLAGVIPALRERMQAAQRVRERTRIGEIKEDAMLQAAGIQPAARSPREDAENAAMDLADGLVISLASTTALQYSLEAPWVQLVQQSMQAAFQAGKQAAEARDELIQTAMDEMATMRHERQLASMIKAIMLVQGIDTLRVPEQCIAGVWGDKRQLHFWVEHIDKVLVYKLDPLPDLPAPPAPAPAAHPDGHVLYETADKDKPDAICDRNGEVALALCRRCNLGEAELQPGVPCSGIAEQSTEDAAEWTAKTAAMFPKGGA